MTSQDGDRGDPEDADVPVSDATSSRGAEERRVLRPEPVVLADEALVPATNLLVPAPNRFSHELSVDEPYRFDDRDDSEDVDGVLRAGTPVLLVVDDRPRCRVADARGLYVEVRRDSLSERAS